MTSTQHILIVEDEDIIRASLRKLLERHEFSVSEAVSVKAAQESFNLSDFDLIISDLRLPGAAGTELIQPAGPVPVLMMTSYASLRSAVDTMRQGAADYISKPFDHEEMLQAVKRIIGESREQPPQTDHRLLMGNSPQILQILRTVHKAAPTSAPVLIQGENGTGRKTIAEIIHRGSMFAEQPFTTVNCAAISASELKQILESNTVGTVFFSNICELPRELQPGVLKAIHRNSFRCVASAERDLQTLSETNQFRKDLYYNLNVVKILVPKLQERGTDIIALAQYFVDRYSSELCYKIELSDSAIQALEAYSWPGNVKELQNKLYQAAILSECGEIISPAMLGLQNAPTINEAVNSPTALSPTAIGDAPAGMSLEDYFTSFVLENQENMSETALAQKLGISRKSLWERRNKLGISRKKA
ncbi:sigma-54 dependent transcriptional regulator [bacterium]|nr:sigma-54 dependent transcriptional regulator [bacterium]